MVTLFRNFLNAHRPIHVNATYLCIFKFTLTKHRMIIRISAFRLAKMINHMIYYCPYNEVHIMLY